MIARLVNWGTAGFELSIDAVEMMLDSLYFCVGLLAFFINHGLRFFYGPHRSLGVSIWQPMKMAKIYKVVNLWGFALWKGLALGYLDALLGRNGHRKTKEK